MRDDSRYLGSVRFYKHLILAIAASVVLIPVISLLFTLVQYRELKQNFDITVNEQLLYIGQLEKKLSYFIEQQEDKDTDRCIEPKESQHALETSGTRNITDENMPLIPFSVDPEALEYLLVNDNRPLSRSFQPELTETRNGQLVHKEIKESLEQMIDDAEKEGLHLIICSAYRDYKKQSELVQNSMEELIQAGCDYTEAYWKTSQYHAMVGRSEHHTGLAVDLVGASHQTLDEDQADTPEGKWLRSHAHEYGFILRYPAGKEEITGIFYESWHYRYVGEPAAAFITEQQICLEEFLDLAVGQ